MYQAILKECYSIFSYGQFKDSGVDGEIYVMLQQHIFLNHPMHVQSEVTRKFAD